MRRERETGVHPDNGCTHTTARDTRREDCGTRVDDRDSSLIAPDDTVSSGVEPQSTLQAFSFPDADPTTNPSPRHDQGKVCSAGTCVVLKHPEKHTGLSRIRTKIHATHRRVLRTSLSLVLFLFFPFCRCEGDEIVAFI